MTIPFKPVRDRWNQDPAYRDAYAAIGPDMELGFAMAEARARARLTQDDVAKRMNTSQGQIARWERGQVMPSTASLRRYAEAVGARLTIRLDPAEV
ncbi:helix-turn-helix transcriptional regulator [Methylobacterium sp. NEAU 140]|uniref:helix-turn-helix domain-containing protein n=1 Tax=Methylobacterium sp. NEAU 140 TaxID=3064945 RepID=UPI0027327AF5|nr:helix-turn-helix transcriptional regulator [Methylobacterium sp. NEAU 140]MDP4025467.1 helix-turn-helix transcriptional regulator [Methylobacterium sp. NEAU 140]